MVFAVLCLAQRIELRWRIVSMNDHFKVESKLHRLSYSSTDAEAVASAWPGTTTGSRVGGRR
jgi:hypothetical protein